MAFVKTSAASFDPDDWVREEEELVDVVERLVDGRFVDVRLVDGLFVVVRVEEDEDLGLGAVGTWAPPSCFETDLLEVEVEAFAFVSFSAKLLAFDSGSLESLVAEAMGWFFAGTVSFAAMLAKIRPTKSNSPIMAATLQLQTTKSYR